MGEGGLKEQTGFGIVQLFACGKDWGKTRSSFGPYESSWPLRLASGVTKSFIHSSPNKLQTMLRLILMSGTGIRNHRILQGW